MAENHAVMLLLGWVAACAAAATAVFLMAASDLRRALRQLHRILNRADRAAGRVQGVVERTCGAAEDALDQISFLKGRVVSLWTGREGRGGGRSRSRKMHRIGN